MFCDENSQLYTSSQFEAVMSLTFQVLVAALFEELGDPACALVFVSFNEFVVPVVEVLLRHHQVRHCNRRNT